MNDSDSDQLNLWVISLDSSDASYKIYFINATKIFVFQ